MGELIDCLIDTFICLFVYLFIYSLFYLHKRFGVHMRTYTCEFIGE